MLPTLLRRVGRVQEALTTYRELWTLHQQAAQEVAEPLGYLRDTNITLDHGILVESVRPDSTAAAAGLRPRDVLLQVNGQEIQSETTPNVLGGKPGETLSVRIKRDDKTMDINISVRPAPTIQLATLSRNMAFLLKEMGRDDEAQEWRNRSLDIAQRYRHTLRFYTPSNSSGRLFFGNFVAELLVNMARYHFRKTPRSVESLRRGKDSLLKAVAIMTPIVEKNPTVTQYQDTLATGLLGLASQSRDSPTQSRLFLEKAISTYQKLVELNPTIADYRFSLANCHTNMAVLSSDEDPDTALTHYHKALQSLESQTNDTTSPLNPVYGQIEGILQRLELLYAELKDQAALTKTRNRINSIQSNRMTALRKQYEASEGDKEIRISLANEINNRAVSRPASTSQDIKQQRASFRSLLKLFGDLPAPGTLDRREADLVSRGHGNLAWYDILEKKYDDAIQKCSTALTYSPQSSWIRSNLALANLLAGHFDDSLKLYRQLSIEADDKAKFYRGVETEFNDLKKKSIQHPDMPRLLKQLAGSS